MGSLDRRLAKLEAQLADLAESLAESKASDEVQIAREALAMLSVPELKLVVAGLERVGEKSVGMPPDTPIPAEVWYGQLTEEEVHVLEYLEELQTELREKAAG